jgi:hypothetical protein
MYAFLEINVSARKPYTYFSGRNYNGPYFTPDRDKIGSKLLYTLEEILQLREITTSNRKRLQGLTEGHAVNLLNISRSTDLYIYRLTQEERDFLMRYEAAINNVCGIREEMDSYIPDELKRTLKAAEKQVRELKKVIDSRTQR